MKKLDDIPKEDFFTVPEGYFERLPGVIGRRVGRDKQPQKISFGYKPAYWQLIPLIVLLAAVLYWANPPSGTEDAEAILASIETEALISYLEESELTLDEILADQDVALEDVEALEEEVYDLPADTYDEITFEIENDSL
jgi:hypothetical protein